MLFRSGLNVGAESPDGNLFHRVAVGDGGLFEAIVDGQRGGAIDTGNLAVSVAEVRGEAGAGGCDGVPANVDAGLVGFVEEESFGEGVHLFRLGRVAGFEWEADIGEQAVRVIEEVGVDGLGEVGWGWRRFAAVAAGSGTKGEGAKSDCCEDGYGLMSANDGHRFSCESSDWMRAHTVEQ